MTNEVYTDGACLGNPGPGGWAWAVPGGRFATGCEARSTNQRMEIAAALDAVRTLDGPLTVVSDSTYVVNCFTKRWWEGWLRRGWLNAAKKPVANRDLWEPFIDLYRQRGEDVTFRWVKGHSGDRMNDLVDRLAVEAATTQEPRAGDEPPSALGPADRPGAGGAGVTDDDEPVVARVGPSPAMGTSHQLTGHPVVVLGHRPPALGGYDDNPVLDALRDRLREVLAAKATLHDDLHVVCGLRLGTEQLAAEAALDLGLPLDVVLPYPDPERVWPAASQAAFQALRARAARVIVLQRRVPATKASAGQAIGRWEAWLAQHAAEAILVWDGADPTLKSVHRTLERHLGDDVWVIDPADLTTRSSTAARRSARS